MGGSEREPTNGNMRRMRDRGGLDVDLVFWWAHFEVWKM